jgi:ribosome maturation factor RimP
MKDWLEEVREIAKTKAESVGVELVKVEYKNAGKRSILRIVIHREGGTGIQDCERVSRSVEAELDAKNLIPGRYSLEVMSRGITLKD